MRNRQLTCHLTLVLCLAATSGAFAQRVTERSLLSGSVGSGARALGMGGAFIAIADDATAASWNPAGLCVLEKPEASVVYQPYAKYTTSYGPSVYTYTAPIANPTYNEVSQIGAETYQATSHAFDFASATFPFRIGSLKLVPQISYQRVIDFGLDATYGAPWTTVTTTRVGSTSITTTERSSDQGSNTTTGGLDTVTASLGLSFTPKLYLGVAVNWWINGSDGSSAYSWQASITDPLGTYANSNQRTTKAVDDFSGTTVNVGLLFKPSDKIRFGAVYKSSATLDYSYTYQAHNETLSQRAAPNILDRDITRKGTIAWPWSAGAGIAVQPTDSLTFSLDFTRTSWSDATTEYTSLTTTKRTSPVVSTTVVPGSYSGSWPTGYDASLPESAYNPKQTDSTQIRFGTEYVITRPGFLGLTAFPLRVGIFDDKQLFKDRPDLGAVHYLGLTGGLGFVWARLSLDFAYVHTRGEYKCCEYPPTQINDGYRVSLTQEEDSFRSHRVYISSTVRF